MKKIATIIFLLGWGLELFCQCYPDVDRTLQEEDVQNNGFILKKQSSVTTEYSGVTFVYRIFYTIPAGVATATVITIVDVVPAPLVVENISTADMTVSPIISGPTTVTYTVPVAYHVPGTHDFQINVHFPAGTTNNGDFVANHACMSTAGSSGPLLPVPICTSDIIVTAVAVENPFIVTKTAVLQQDQNQMYHACIGKDVTYTLTISKSPSCYYSTYGQQNLYSVLLGDIIPPGANFVQPIGSNGIFNISSNCGATVSYLYTIGNAIVFQIPYLDAGACGTAFLQFSFKISYPAAVIGDIVQNCAQFSAFSGNQIIQSNQSCVNVQFGAPTFGGIPQKTVTIENPVPGCKGMYQLTVTNNQTGDLPDCNFFDNIPSEVLVTKIVFNPVNLPVSLTINGGATPVYSGTPAAGHTWDNLSNQTISNISVDLGGGLAPCMSYSFYVYFTVGTNVIYQQDIDNTMTLSFPNSIPYIPPSTSPIARFTIENFKPKICAFKSLCTNQPSYTYGETVRYRLRIKNYGSGALTGATITEMLNANLTYISGSETYYSSTTGNPPCGTPGNRPAGTNSWNVISRSTNPVGQQTRIDWNLSQIDPDCEHLNISDGCSDDGVVLYYFIEFDAVVKQNALAGSVPNEFTVSGGTLPAQVTSNTEYITINGVFGALAEKFISIENGPWKKSATVAPGCEFMYRLWFKNTSNFPVDNIIFVDMLPMDYTSSLDRMILDRAKDRGSNLDLFYSGVLNSGTLPTVNPANNLTVRVDGNQYYNICLDQEFGYPQGCTAPMPNWVSAGPGPYKSVKFIMDPNFSLQPGQVLTCDFKVKIPNNTPLNLNACNSFALISTGHYYIMVNGTVQLQTVSPTPTESDVVCLKTKRTIHGYKFDDINGNGIWEPDLGEKGIEGWKILIWNGETVGPSGSCLTDANGYFEFNNIGGNLTYQLYEESQPLYSQTFPGNPSSYLLSPPWDCSIYSDSFNFGNHPLIIPPCCMDPPENMNNWWPLDEKTGGTTAHDIEDYHNNGTYAGSPNQVTGKVLNALEFDDVNDYVEVPTHTEVNFGVGDFSFDAWIRISSCTGDAIILDKLQQSNQGYCFYVHDGYLGLKLRDGGSNDLAYFSSVSLICGNWNHVAVTVDRQSPYGIIFYINRNPYPAGNLPASMGSITNSIPLRIGGTTIVEVLDEIETFTCVLNIEAIQLMYDKDWQGKCKSFYWLLVPHLTHPHCALSSTGSIELVVNSNDTSNLFTYLWSTGSTSSTISGLSAGTYSVNVKAENGESVFASYELTDPPALSVIANSTSTECQNASTGSINLTVTGGAPPYSYLWSNGATTQNISGLSEGTYTVTVSDTNECTLTVSQAVSANAALPVSLSLSASANPVCSGSPVTYTATPVNGGATPSYQWLVNGINVGANSPAYTYTPVNGDVISVVLVSSETCSSGNPATSNSVTMVVNSLSVPTITGPASVCLNSSGNVYVTQAGMSGYDWAVSAGGIIIAGGNSTDNFIMINWYNAGPKTVSVAYLDSYGCTTTDPAFYDVIVNLSLPVSVSITASANPIFPGASVTFTATPVNGGTPAYQWYVNGIPAGSGSAAYTYVPANGDQVYVLINSDLECVSGNPATSNIITVQFINPNMVGYGYITYPGTGSDPKGPMSFTLSNPGSLTSIANQNALQIVTAGTWANGNWYGTVYNSAAPFNFIKINTVTGARTVIGDMGTGMNGLSYNPSDGLMYAIGYNGVSSGLYTINMVTGTPTLVGSANGVLLINLAINNGGQAYAVDLNTDMLGEVNLSTGAFTAIGSIGFNAQYAQDMEFDRDANVLYMTAYGTQGELRYVDINTGATSLIGAFEGGAEITGFAIPYTAVTLADNAGAVSIDMSRVISSGTVSPKATVRNFGSNPETFPVSMTIGTYTSTRSSGLLAPGASVQLTFDPWSCGVGDHTVSVCTQLADDMNPANNCKSKPVKALDLNKTVYGYNAYRGTGTDPEGPMTFNLSNPGSLASLANQSALQFVSGGTWANGIWYGTVYNTAAPYNFVRIDPVTGTRTIIGNTGVVMNGLSYNPSDGIMYAVGPNASNSDLYTINMATGTATIIGSATGVLLTNLAISNTGQAYAVDLNADVLGTVNLATGAFTAIGSIGFDAQYAQDMEFDRDEDVLYMTAEDANSGWLACVDVTTGNSLKIADFEGGADVTGFAIPYEGARILNVKVVLEGLYDGGDIMRQAQDEYGPHFGAGIADKVDIELHNSADYSVIEYSSGPVDMSTTGNITISTIPAAKSGYYYITVRHRNSIETTSAAPVSFAAGITNYDFTTAAGQAYGSNMKDVGSVFAIWGGDANQDGIVDGADMSGIYNVSQPPALTGYYPEDVNGDGIVDGADMSLIYNNSQPPPVQVRVP